MMYLGVSFVINLGLFILTFWVLLVFVRLLRYRKDLFWVTALLKVPSAIINPVRKFSTDHDSMNLSSYDSDMKNARAKRLGWGPKGMYLYVSKSKKIHVYSKHTDQEFIFEPKDLRGGLR